MTLSRLIDSLTGRAAAATPAQTPGAASSPHASPELAAMMMQCPALLFVPSQDTDRALGAQKDVRDRIADVLPGVVFDDVGRGAFARTGYTVTFDTGTEEYVHAVGVQVTGGAAAIPPLARLISKTGWRLVAQAPDHR
jgi:hypothetical protein